MLKLSRLSDYAAIITGCLANHNAYGEGNGLTVSQVQHLTGLAKPTVAKLLKLLARHGILDSKRGAKGGYGLSKPIEDISIKDIVEAVDGPISLTDCVDTHGTSCMLEKSCHFSGRWAPVNDAICNVLENISIAQLMAKNAPIKELNRIHQTDLG